MGALLVYDITSRKSFEEVHRWLKELKNEAHPESVVMLIGNKSDLEDKREISCEEAMRFAVKNDLMFMETSALSNVNVEEAFNALVTNIFDKLATKLVTMDDKRAELLKGQTITLTPNEPNTTNYSSSSSSSCAC